MDAATERPGDGPVDVVTPLILDMLEWLAAGPRPYVEVMDVWRTSCPRLTVWEDAVDFGFVARTAGGGRDAAVSLTARGRARLGEAGRG
jgi:hypothetical protein